MDESYLSFSALVRTDPVAHSPQSPHQTPQPDPGLWNIESDWTLLFYFSPPSLVSLWLNVFYLSVGVTVGGVWGKRKKEGGTRRRRRRRQGFCGTSRRDERGLSLLYSPRLSSFQLFEASHQTGLNSRRDTICLSSTTTSPILTTTSLLGISPAHPSILPSPPYLSRLCPLSTCDYRHPSTHSLAHNAAQWPLTGGQRERNKLARIEAESEH